MTAVASVTLKNAAAAMSALMLTILAVAGILIYLDFVGLSFLYLIVMGAGAAGLYIVALRKKKESLEPIRLESQPRTSPYFIMALMVFTGSLFLIAHTDVWQYAVDVRTISFTALWQAVINNYTLPIFCLTAFILILSLIVILKFRREGG